MITGKEIVKTYGVNEGRRNVLNEVNITIEDGEFVAVMGPSGCGKSTLLFSLSGTDDISGGSVNFDGAELSALSENQLADLRRERMGFVFQQPTMLKNLNLLDNIMLPGIQGRCEKGKLDAIRNRAGDLMERTGIAEFAARSITEVSGGQLQRAGICRALINSPDILFADEPTGSLNSKAADEVMDLFGGINDDGTTIMLVTHDAKVAARASRILFMKDGEIVQEIDWSDFRSVSREAKIEMILERMKVIEI